MHRGHDGEVIPCGCRHIWRCCAHNTTFVGASIVGCRYGQVFSLCEARACVSISPCPATALELRAGFTPSPLSPNGSSKLRCETRLYIRCYARTRTSCMDTDTGPLSTMKPRGRFVFLCPCLTRIERLFFLSSLLLMDKRIARRKECLAVPSRCVTLHGSVAPNAQGSDTQ